MAESKSIPAGAEVIKFFGIAPFDFIPEGQKESISGVNMWYMTERKGVYGYVPAKVKISVEDFNNCCEKLGVIRPEMELLNVDLVCTFNRFGKCNGFYYL